MLNDNGPPCIPAESVAADPTTKRRFAAQIYRTRELRTRFFPGSLFAEPAWDILLLIYGVEPSRERLSVSAVCASAGAPYTTVFRWIEKLIQEGLIVREEHPRDRRAHLLHLSERATALLDAYFDQVLTTEFSGRVAGVHDSVHAPALSGKKG